jgi:hypothetical protein
MFWKTEWEIYRGDEFQLEINQKTLRSALRIKAYFKTLKLDAEVLVLETKHMQQIKFLSNGTAFAREKF